MEVMGVSFFSLSVLRRQSKRTHSVASPADEAASRFLGKPLETQATALTHKAAAIWSWAENNRQGSYRARRPGVQGNSQQAGPKIQKWRCRNNAITAPKMQQTS